MTAQPDDIEYDETDVVDTDTDNDANDWSPPTREDYERLLAESRKASSEAANRKRMLRELGYDKNGNPLNPTNDSEEKPRSQPASGNRAVSEKAIAKKYEAIYSGLATAGVPAGQLSRVARLIDASAVVVDEDGIEGLSEQIESLRTDYADFFKRPRTKAADAAVVGGGKKPVAPTKTSRTWEDEVRERFNKGLI